MSTHHPSPVLQVNEAADYLRLSRPTIYRLVADGQLKKLKLAGRTVFRKADLDKLIDEAVGV